MDRPRRISPSVSRPIILSFSSTTETAPSPLSVMINKASVTVAVPLTTGFSLPPCMMSPTVSNSCRPRLPPGWNTANCLEVKLCFPMSAMASASPKARAAVVLEVGASPRGQASLFTPTFRTTSAFFARVESVLPTMAMSFAPIRRREGSMFSTSPVSPLLDMAMITSSAVTMPRSPWIPSAGCR